MVRQKLRLAGEKLFGWNNQVEGKRLHAASLRLNPYFNLYSHMGSSLSLLGGIGIATIENSG
jgi:hypothetical protein